MGAWDRVDRLCATDLDERALRVALLAELRARFGFDSYAWPLTDPQTCVGTAPVAAVPSLADLPTLIRLKYQTQVNRWTSLAPGTAATTLLAATGSIPARSLVWAELLCRYAVTDVANLVFADQYGCWGFLDLWRCGGAFTPAEVAALSDFARVVTGALRSRVAGTFATDSARSFPSDEPVVLLLDADLRLLDQTRQADAFLRALLPGPGEAAPIPAAAYNVAAQLLARRADVDNHPARARAHLGGGLWVTLSAAWLGATHPPGPAIAVAIEPTTGEQRSALFARATGLSPRETQLLDHLIEGASTHELAQRLYLSEHTVQDHLKSIFAKTGVHSRRTLVARATGGTSAEPSQQ